MAAKRPRSTDPGTMFIRPFHLLLSALAHWVNREQSNVINYLREESRILRERNRQGLGNKLLSGEPPPTIGGRTSNDTSPSAGSSTTTTGRPNEHLGRFLAPLYGVRLASS